MSVQVMNKSKTKASMRMRIKRADGTVIDLGVMSNRPIIRHIQRWLVERRIRKLNRRRAQ